MKKSFGAAAGLIAAVTLMLTAAPAMARVNIDLNIGVPGGYAQPGPVHVHPSPVYVQPPPVYVHPRPGYVEPRPVYVHPRPGYMEQQHHRDWRERQWHQQQMMRSQRDRDRDGIPNRVDRDRDGDGIPNWHDKRPNNPYRY